MKTLSEIVGYLSTQEAFANTEAPLLLEFSRRLIRAALAEIRPENTPGSDSGKGYAGGFLDGGNFVREQFDQNLKTFLGEPEEIKTGIV